MLLDQYRSQLRWEQDGVVELGTGDASAIADVVRSLPGLRVRSYDISAPSVERARRNIAARGVADRYTVELGDFFDAADSAGGLPVSTVIANPPYIPAPDRPPVELGAFSAGPAAAGALRGTGVLATPPHPPPPARHILMPELWGGVHANDLVLRLLKAGYQNAIVAVPSYSDPATTVATG